MKLKILIIPVFILMFAVRALSASPRTMEILRFKGGEKTKPTIFSYNPDESENYTVPLQSMNFTINTNFDLTDNRTGEKFPMNGGALFGLTCLSLMNTAQRGSISNDLLFSEIKSMGSANSAAMTLFAIGEWQPYLEWYKIASELAKNFDPKTYPMFSYGRPNPKIFARGTSVLEILRHLAGADVELHVIKAGLAMVAGQLPIYGGTSTQRFKRIGMPWQRHPEVKDHFTLKDGQIGWELGRAITTEPELEQKLLPAAVTQAVREAAYYGVAPEDAFLIAHAPDLAHTILYRRRGFKIVSPMNEETGKQDKSAHGLGVMSLKEALENPAMNPSLFSKRIELFMNLSKRSPSFMDAVRFFDSVEYLMDRQLNYVDPNLDSDDPQTEIFVTDRSRTFYDAAHQLFTTYGLDAQSENALQKLMSETGHFSHNEHHVSSTIIPEQLADVALEPGLFVSSLNEGLARKDSSYLMKVLFGVAELYKSEMAPFVNLNSHETARANFITVLTPSRYVAEQLASLGGLSRLAKWRQVDFKAGPDILKMGEPIDDLFCIRFTHYQVQQFRSSLARLGYTKDSREFIRRGYWHNYDWFHRSNGA